ncbi:MAG: replication initiator protein [Microvirus sp.]|nr:MAG: replication initiator protein [Microvirus sp.]
MPCYHPMTAWRSQDKNASGKRSLIFTSNGAFGDALQIPCGKCIGCRLDRSPQWATRLQHEGQFYDKKCFITLTYAPEHLPEGGSLQIRDLQLFFKRLRSAITGRGSGAWTPPLAIPRRLRYLACGEYGDQFLRPHYHAILFGVDFTEDRRLYGMSRNGQHERYTSERLTKIWGMGRSEIGSVTTSSTGYVARYTMKKVYGERAEEHYQGRKPEFLVCSQGIGLDWFLKYKDTDLYADMCVIKTAKGYSQVRVPAYYDKKQPEEVITALKEKRKHSALSEPNNRPHRLPVREECTMARVKSLKRGTPC